MVRPLVSLLALLLTLTSVARAADAPDTTATDTLRQIVRLPEVVVSTARADARAPQALSIVKREELAERNWGQDTPMALATLPGAYAYSDAGNGIGYSYLSIRGFPQRRISVLVNGVPLNDPESHEVYWIDHPDLLASTAELQLQRGVGSALYGAASVGGSVNLETAPTAAAPRLSAALGYGSYDTKRLMMEGLSGPLAGGWDLYGALLAHRDRRLSRSLRQRALVVRVLGAQGSGTSYVPPQPLRRTRGDAPRISRRAALRARRRSHRRRRSDRRFNPLT
jgi:outer membrane receptor protein involved in Fe transport